MVSATRWFSLCAGPLLPRSSRPGGPFPTGSAGSGGRSGGLYDLLMAPLERTRLGPARRRLLAGVEGRVLELGAGTGANLRWYPPTVEHLDLCEPDARMRRRLDGRVATGSWPFSLAVHDVTAEGPFPSGSYDAVVTSLMMCSVPDPRAATTAIRAVLADGGRYCYLEHVHAGGLLGRLQPLMTPLWSRLTGGCHLDRPATAALRGAGLVPVEQHWLRLPPPLGLAIEGQAIVRVRPEQPGLP